MRKRTDLELMQEIYDLLQGTVPAGVRIPDAHLPNLAPDQAWTVCWHLGNLYWQPSDEIERCGDCGEIYDSAREGTSSIYTGQRCDACRGEQVRCAVCQEEDDRHVLLAVFDDSAGVPDGVYLIVDYPYYADGIIEGHLYKRSLERVGDVPEGADGRGWPCGHLCRGCGATVCDDYSSMVERSAWKAREMRRGAK